MKVPKKDKENTKVGRGEEKMTHPDRFAVTPLKRGFFGLDVAQ
jgi:hypothetical protein